MPLVSLLIPVYNAVAYLGELFPAIQAQTFKEFEVIIVDDGSTDDTVKGITPFLSDPRIQLHRSSKNHGLAFSWRMLLELARGEYWCAVGADDILEPNFLEQRVTQLAASSDACLLHGRARLINEHGTVFEDPMPLPPLPPLMEGREALSMLLQHNIINQNSTLVRMSATRSVLGHAMTAWRFSPDWALWFLHAATERPLLFDPEPCVRYRIHSQSLTGAVSLSAMRRAEVRLTPLCALSAAAAYSVSARLLWMQWREALYALWLRRAFALRKEQYALEDALQLAAYAFYGTNKGRITLAGEMARHGISIVRHHFLEESARSRQRFKACGLAQVDHPLFHQ